MYVLDRFDVLISKMIFKKWKNIIGMHFGTKSYLKSTRNHTAKHALNLSIISRDLLVLLAIYSTSVFGSVVAGAFQITFRAKMHANDVFSFLKNYFWHQHIKTIQNIQTILNFNKKKFKFFRNAAAAFPNIPLAMITLNFKKLVIRIASAFYSITDKRLSSKIFLVYE